MRSWLRRLCPIVLLLSITGSKPPAVASGTYVARSLERATWPSRLFVSGHSLTDRPFPDYVAAIAGSAGSQLYWNMQHLFGSSLQERTRGLDHSLSGYRQGVDREGEPVDVLRELKGDQTGTYDALLLAEQHSLLESLVWKDMIGSVLDYEARFRAANPNGKTYLFSSWLNLATRDDPADWISYERAAAPAWQCTSDQINRSLAARGADTRVTLIPAAEGLAALVSHVLEAGLGPVGANNPHGTIALLFSDDVHLTPTGTYYVALLTHGVMHGVLPDQAWVPQGTDLAIARELLPVARAFLAQRAARTTGMSDAACKSYLADFVPHYLSYVRDVKWRGEGRLRAYFKWLRFRISWPQLFRADSSSNPLRIRES